MSFPYEIRKVPAGQWVTVPDGENTVAWSVEQNDPFAQREQDRVRAKGPQLPFLHGGWWLISSVAFSCPGDDREVLFSMVEDTMETLPDLKHKFMLVYNTGETMFWNCFLVATDNEEWWREFAVVESP
jgi:hypothetical protein